MQINDFNVENYIDTARSRTTNQFDLESSPIFDKYLQLLISGFQEAEELLEDLMKLRSVDTAFGAQLDIIGEIVGQDRELIAADLYDFFGMDGAVGAYPMGDINDPTVGGYFFTYGTDLGGNVNLDDETYRKFIKAKIYKNNTSSSPEEFINAVKMIFDVDQVSIIESGNAEATVLFGRHLSNFERVLINYVSNSKSYPSRLIPRPIGVNINFGEYQADNYFGFQDSPNAKGFGDGASPTSGGIFATIYQ